MLCQPLIEGLAVTIVGFFIVNSSSRGAETEIALTGRKEGVRGREESREDSYV